MNRPDRQADRQQKNLLYDFYGNLLTDKQRACYEMYYMEDLSYSEIAELESVSTQAVADLLKRTVSLLERYEKKLCLLKRHQLQQTLAQQIYTMLDRLFDSYSAQQVAAIQRHMHLYLTM